MHFWGHCIMNLLENMDHELWESKNVVYCYTNKINGKKYVGQTIQKLRKRHGQHLSGKQLIDKKLKQYGVENFKLEVLHLADMYSIDMLERHYIYFFDTFVKNGKGYNVSSGGHNGSPWAGKTEEELEEWKVKYGTPIVGVGIDSILSYKYIEEAKKDGFNPKRISTTCTYHHNPEVFLGKYKHRYVSHKGYKWYYKEDYDRLSEEKKSRTLLKNIVAISTKSEEVLFFENISQISNSGFNINCVYICCRGESKTHKGYKWYYKEDYDKLTEEEIKLEISLISNMKTSTPRGVVGVFLKDSNKKIFYDFIGQAIKDGFSDSAICGCCKNKLKMYKGYKWYYKEDYDKMSDNDIKLEIDMILNKGKSVVGVSLENSDKKLFYDTMAHAAKDGFNNSVICGCCKGKRGTHKGYKWYYKEDYDKMIKETN